MAKPPYRNALIVGAGAGLSASLARLFAAAGMTVALAARRTDKLANLAAETAASLHQCDATQPAEVERLFAEVDDRWGEPDVVVYNASGRARGPLISLTPTEVAQAIAISAFGGFLVSQQAARRMLPLGRGAILLTGATASVKGFPLSTAFAMGKFALRGMAQSMARELAPKGVHVCHFVIDGGIRSAARPDPEERPDSTLDPDAIAQSYWDVMGQHRSAWSWEIELRPWVETY
jgi:NAD(P)-dependent dehydrogenase (short-subunit alcohol dehydrogenase family)